MMAASDVATRAHACAREILWLDATQAEMSAYVAFACGFSFF
jgi:hypothetical protein